MDFVYGLGVRPVFPSHRKVVFAVEWETLFLTCPRIPIPSASTVDSGSDTIARG